jgi:hypothetical protein
MEADKTVRAHGYTLSYNDAKHKYWITTPTGEEFPVYGMTTVQKPIGSIQFNQKTGAVTSKSDTLMAWAVSEVKKALLAGEPVEEAVKAHTRKSDYSKDFGHKVHKIIEDATHSHNNNQDYLWLSDKEHDVARKIFDNDRNTGTITLAQELLVFMPSNPEAEPHEWKDWIAGTFDRITLRDGRIELQDHKTSSGVYDLNYYVQLMGYQSMLEWMMKDPDNSYAETLSVLRDKPIEARRVNLATKVGTFTDQWVSTNEEDDRRMFKATLDIFNTSKKYRHLFW